MCRISWMERTRWVVAFKACWLSHGENSDHHCHHHRRRRRRRPPPPHHHHHPLLFPHNEGHTIILLHASSSSCLWFYGFFVTIKMAALKLTTAFTFQDPHSTLPTPLPGHGDVTASVSKGHRFTLTANAYWAKLQNGPSCEGILDIYQFLSGYLYNWYSIIW